MEKEISRTVQHSKQIESEFEEKTMKLKVQKQEMEEALESTKTQLDQKYKSDVQHLVGSHKNEVTDIRKEFDKVLRDLRCENEAVNDRLVELQEIYDTRPSKPEDLDLIQLLQSKMADVDDIIRKKDEELK
jgi:F0F1-type ATP synthase membrane subunit b/b'